MSCASPINSSRRNGGRRSGQNSIYISQLVLLEASRGDSEAADKRIEALRGIPFLQTVPEVDALADLYRKELQTPKRAEADSVHLAYSVYYRMEYLLTWNCSHLQNPLLMKRVAELNHRLGKHVPLIATPEQMLAMIVREVDDAQ